MGHLSVEPSLSLVGIEVLPWHAETRVEVVVDIDGQQHLSQGRSPNDGTGLSWVRVSEEHHQEVGWRARRS